MSKYRLKSEVFLLRKSGLSLSEIGKKLNLSKGTVSVWCADIKLTNKQRKRLKEKVIKAGLVGRTIGAQSNKDKKILSLAIAKKESIVDIKKINQDIIMLVVTALYWAEGSKKSGRFQFVNSDPEMIKIVLNYLLIYEKIPLNDIRVNVQINEIHRPRIKKVLNYWKKYLNLTSKHIGNTSYVKTKNRKIYLNYNEYYGICRLRVVKSTNLLYKMLARIDRIKTAGVVQW